jgi:sugar lactone lactonase YvrE
MFKDIEYSKVMKNNPSVAEKGAQVNWLRAARRAVACAAVFALGVASATAQSLAVSTHAGQTGVQGSAEAPSGPATVAQFKNPSAVAVDSSGNLYIADTGNHKIRKVTSAGVVSTLAGTGAFGSVDNVTGTSASFNFPQGIAIDSTGTNLYVADTYNHTIRKIVISSTAVSTIAGLVGTPTTGQTDNAVGTSARFNYPVGIVVDSTNANLYVADTSNNSIRRIILTGTFDVSTFAGSTAGTAGTTNDTGNLARFDHPNAIAADATNLYVADTNNHAIRQIVITSKVVTTLSGTVGTMGSTDSSGGTPSFRFPSGIAVNGANLVVADTANHTLRQVVISSGFTSTIAGTVSLAGNTDALGTAARFNGLTGLTVATSGTIYIADTNNQTIRRAGASSTPTVSNPANTAVAVGATATFTVTTGGNPTPTIVWERQAAGTTGFVALTNNGVYTGVNTLTLSVTNVQTTMNGDQFRATVTNGVGSATSATPATLTVQLAPTITSAASANFALNVVGSFTITATGSPAPTFGVTGTFPSWATLNTSTGVISGTPTNNTGSPFTFTITATNGVGSPASQSFTLTVQNGAVISTQPANITVSPSGTANFSVIATGTPSTFTYQWYRNAGGVSGFFAMSDISGTYTGSTSATLTVFNAQLGMNGDQFYVVVSNGVGTPVTSTPATLTVAVAPQITSLNSTIFAINSSNLFTVQATGSPTPTFSYTGTFPPWASLNASTGALTGTPTNDTGSPFNFTLIASNGYSSPATQSFTLTVTPAGAYPAFTTQPISASVSIGQPATFTSVATGVPAPTYQWQRQYAAGGGFFNINDDSSFSGTQTANLTVINATTGMNGDQFQVIASNTVNGAAASATSNVVTLTVNVGTIISTVAGTAGVSATVDGTGLAAQFTNPNSIAADLAGNLYVADPSAHVIRKISAAGVVTTFAGSPGQAGSVDGQGSVARFNGPSGVAVDGSGNIYVADTNNHTIRGISPSGNVLTLAGSPGLTGSVDGLGTSARFTYPFGLAVDGNGTIFVSDTFNHTIRRIAQNSTVSTVAGAAGVRGTANGTGSGARFAFPTGITVDSYGFVYVADSNNGAIRVINIGTTEVGTYAGVIGSFGTADGAATSAARFNQPNGVTVDSNRVVYVADSFSHTIRRIGAPVSSGTLPVAGDVSTLAGLAGTVGTADGAGTTARFNQPNGITVDSSGNVYIADTQNRTIRRSGAVTAASIVNQPSNASTAPGGTATFTVSATGAPAPSNYRWQRKPADASTDFVNLSDDSTYSGTTTATLTISNVAATMNNDQFRVIVSNFISPEAVSNAATLSTVIAAPVFTSAASTSFRATELGAFTVAATGNPSPSYSLSGQPSWLSINASTGVMSGTAPDTSGSPLSFTVTASNGVAVNQTFTLTVTPAIVAPAITVQPVGGTIALGQNANFSVTATGTALAYQWSRDGAAIGGATNASLTLTGVQYGNAGNYTVTVSNSIGSVTSAAAPLLILTPPTITQQPVSQTVLAGGTVSFTVAATGTPAPKYQWRVNGGTMAGATNATLTLSNVQAVNVANYDVVVTNDVGGLLSSLAQLTLATSVTSPVITAAPMPRTVVVGSSTTLSVGVSSAAAVTYQWRQNGNAIAGAVSSTLTLTNVQLGSSGNYDVIVTNSAGSVTSPSAAVTVVRRSYAGYYLGSFGGTNGSFALYVRPDNTAVFLGYFSSASVGIRNTALTINDAGNFSVGQGSVTVAGNISDGGTITGNIAGVSGATLSGSKTVDFGSSLAASGFYQGAAVNTSSTISAIVTPVGQAFVFVQTSAADGGQAAIDSNNRITLSTARQSIIATVTPATSTIVATVTAGTVVTAFTGASEGVLSTQRLANISTRARVGVGESVVIAGFVISGQNSKPVLIRAIGPGLAAFGVTTALTAPKLELYRAGNSTAIASNTNWTTSSNTASIVAATLQAGAFALGNNSADSVIFATLAPGAYTAVISSANNTPGVALAEVYDLSAPAAGQKLFNISTRASTGTGDSILTAGIAITGSVPKRLLIRGVGPSLTPLGVTGALAQPQLTVVKDGVTVAANSGWSTSPDATAISDASLAVGAFGLLPNSLDAAMIVSLAPGNYSALVAGANGTAGVAIIEVYELP